MSQEPAIDGRSAVVLCGVHDETVIPLVLRRAGIASDVVPSATAAFAAVVRGAGLVLVNAGEPDAVALLRAVRRRVDDGWSDCTLLAYYPTGVDVDAEVSALIDAVVPAPMDVDAVQLALRVADSLRHDRPPVSG